MQPNVADQMVSARAVPRRYGPASSILSNLATKVLQVTPMLALQHAEPSLRYRILAAELSRLRVESHQVGAADTIHSLINTVSTVQGALGLVETRLTEGRDDDVERLLDLAEMRIRQGRSLVVQARRRRFHYRRSATAAAA